MLCLLFLMWVNERGRRECYLCVVRSFVAMGEFDDGTSCRCHAQGGVGCFLGLHGHSGAPALSAGSAQVGQPVRQDC